MVRADVDADSIAIHPVGVLALGFDHRVVSLTMASAFVSRVRDLVEGRDWSVEL